MEVNDPTELHPMEGVDSLFEERAAINDNRDFERGWKKWYLLGILSALALIAVLYGLSPLSRVRAISVKGNNYLSIDYIRSISGVTLNSFYYLQFPDGIAARVKSDPLIFDCTVSMVQDNVIEITVTERQPFGYRYDGDTPVILCTDGTTADLTSDYMSMLSRIPFVTGFDEDQQTHLLANAFSSLSASTISSISEVSQYSLSYDDEALEVRMADGGILFASYYTLSCLNEYDQFAAYLTNKSYCLYASEGGSVAYSAACPWDQETVSYDYWMNDDGTYVTNKWGDRVVKHYYQDENGDYYLDKSGNWILIPIDSTGADDPDPDFLDHYLSGYYDTGTLVIPDENTGESGTDTGDSTANDTTTDNTGTQDNAGNAASGGNG